MSQSQQKQKSLFTANPEDLSGPPMLEQGTSLQARCHLQQIPGTGLGLLGCYHMTLISLSFYSQASLKVAL